MPILIFSRTFCAHFALFSSFFVASGGKGEKQMKPKYISQDSKLIPTTPEVAREATNHANQAHYAARKRRECWAGQKQMAHCEGDCPTCRCYTNRPASLDDIGYQRNAQIDNALRCVEMLVDMQCIDPRGYSIGKMIIAGYSSRDIASRLGLAPSTYHDLIVRIRKHLREE